MQKQQTITFFIRKNNSELRQKLKNIGIKKNPYLSIEEFEDDNLYLTIIIINNLIDVMTCYPNSKLVDPKTAIDCEDDEDKFFKLINEYKN